MKKAFKENLIKNIIVGSLLIPGYFSIQSSFINSAISSDKSTLGSLLVAVSILAVIACFGNYAFTYEKVKTNDSKYRILVHLATGVLILIIGFSLEMTSIITKMLIGNFPIFDLSLVLLYIASVLFDFWDLHRSDL